MVTSLNDLLKQDLESRGLRAKPVLAKTLWEKKIEWRNSNSKGHYWLWICNVHEDHVVVYGGNIPSQDYPRHRTWTFQAADPDFLQRVFQAVDKAILERTP